MNKLCEFIKSPQVSSVLSEMEKAGFTGVDELRKVKANDGIYVSIPILVGDRNVTAEVMFEIEEGKLLEINLWALLDLYETGLSIEDADIDFFYSTSKPACKSLIRDALYKQLSKVVVIDRTVAKCNKKFNGNNIEVFVGAVAKLMKLSADFNAA